MTPVRYKRLAETCNGICISGQWLVVSLDQAVRVYSLPHLDPGQEIRIVSPRYPRADVDGRIYVPGTDGVSILKIHGTGNVILVRNLTGGGSVTNVRAVALGPRKGQLLVAFRNKLFVLRIEDDTVTRSLHPPRLMFVHSLAVDSRQIRYWSHTGHILVTYRFNKDRVYDLLDMAVQGRINWLRSETRHFIDGRINGYRGQVPKLRLGLQDLHDIPSQLLQTVRQSLIKYVEIDFKFKTFPATHSLAGYGIRGAMQDLAQPAHLAVYNGSVLTSSLLTTNSLAGITASNGGFFVVDNQHSNLHIYNTTGSLRYTIDSVNGRHGLWLTGLTDVAVWQDCLWLVTRSGHLVLLCPA